MTDAIILPPKRSRDGHGEKLSLSIRLGERYHAVEYKVTGAGVSDGVAAGLAVVLLPAMKTGSRVQLPTTVSTKLLTGAAKIQTTLHGWDPTFRKVDIQTESAAATRESGGRNVGCFFTGGLDSFYTLLKRRQEISHLIFVHGFDISLQNEALRNRVASVLREAARAFGKSLVEVTTDLRVFSDRYVSWEMYNGAALASVALTLSPEFRTIYVAASHSRAHSLPWGSHPLLDPLWSTESLDVIHDGNEATRPEKAALVAGSDVALRTLRVCWRNPEGAYNCGRCEKCLRTMVNLQLAGALSRCTAFDRPLDLRAVARVRIRDASVSSFVEENIEAAERSGQHLALVRALHDCLNGRYTRGPQRNFWRLLLKLNLIRYETQGQSL